MSESGNQKEQTDVKTIVRAAVLESEKLRSHRNKKQDRNLWQCFALFIFVFTIPTISILLITTGIVGYLNAGVISADQYIVALAILTAAVVFLSIAVGIGYILIDIGDNLRAITESIKQATEKDEYGIAELLN